MSEGGSREEQGIGDGREKSLCGPNNLWLWPSFQELIAPEITESWTSNSGSPGRTSDDSEEVVSGSLKRMVWLVWGFSKLAKVHKKEKGKESPWYNVFTDSKVQEDAGYSKKKMQINNWYIFKVIDLIILWEWFFETKPDTFLLYLRIDLNF